MMIIGCDLHTRYQQIAMLDTDTGELVERRLEHENGEAQAFYAALSGTVRVGIEATGYTHWFEAMLAELGHELWMGDAAKIRASVIRKQKTDARDAAHLLDLMRQDRFPKISRPSPAERDLRQLVWHRQKLVWMRGAVKNQLHALAMGEGVCRKKKLFTAKGRKELEGLVLGPWASYRRQELLRRFDEMAAATAQLDAAVEQAAKSQPLAVRLMKHPGVGPVTSLAFVLIIGVSDVFAAALWSADYSLLLASNNYSGINLHGGTGKSVANSVGGFLPGDVLLKEKGETPDQIATHPHPFYTPIATFGSEYRMEPVAYGLKFAGEFSGAALLQGDFTSQLQAMGVDATAYAATFPTGQVAVSILNKDAEQNLQVSLDFGTRGSGRVKTKTLHAPALDSREVRITQSPEPGHLQDGKYTVTVPHATGIYLTLGR